MARLKDALLATVALVYLFNPTAGFLELIPDNIPLIGNLDETSAVLLLLNSLRNLGFNFFGLLAVRGASPGHAGANRPKTPQNAGYRPPSLEKQKGMGNMPLLAVLGLLGVGAAIYWIGYAFSDDEPTRQTTVLGQEEPAETDSAQAPQTSKENAPPPEPQSASPALLANLKLEALPAGTLVYADSLGIALRIDRLENEIPVQGKILSQQWAGFEQELWLAEKAGEETYAAKVEGAERLAVGKPVNCRTEPEVSRATVAGKLQPGEYDLLESKPDEIYGHWHKVRVKGYVRL